MKKLLSLGLVASLSFAGLVACGGNDTEAPSTGSESGSTTESTEKPATSGEKVEIK